MKLTHNLMEEHKLINRMIDVLESAANQLEENKEITPDIFDKAADFIRTFADKFHHAKEEDILFKEMIKKGMPEKDSPVEAMLIEHEQGREFVKGLIKATAEFKEGNKKKAKEIIENARGYIELLREHIDKEDNILYPLAEKMFTKSEKEKQLDKFKEAEISKGGNKTVSKYMELVKELESR